jgi:hypothetical protein
LPCGVCYSSLCIRPYFRRRQLKNSLYKGLTSDYSQRTHAAESHFGHQRRKL